jgi:DNA-binding MarR family transcriptional regulator
MESGAVTAAGAAIDIPNRDLMERSARFAHGFLRWLDGPSTGGLTYPRLRVLETLHCQGPARMKDLADGLGLSARNLTTLADALEDDGLVQRTAHPTDRRVTLLALTDAGRTAADESLAPRLAEISRLFDVLTPAAKDNLASALDALADAMCAEPCPGPQD